MPPSGTTPDLERHPGAIRAVHWGTAIAITVAVAAILGRELTEEKGLRLTLLEVHRQLGLLILFGLVVRLLFRWKLGLADTARDLSLPMRIAATGAHVVMYLVVGALTLLGWALCSAHAIHLKFLGVVPVPDLVRADSDLADNLSDYHVAAAWVLLGLVVFHVAAALWHHYIRKDGVLVAMLPGKTRPVPAPLTENQPLPARKTPAQKLRIVSPPQPQGELRTRPSTRQPGQPGFEAGNG
jgi:cytochrome b561